MDNFSAGQTVVDVGINYSEAKGKLVGDVDFDAVEPIVAAISPVPAGGGQRDHGHIGPARGPGGGRCAVKALSDALLGFLAGFVITLGATAYLSLESTMAGALMFTVGLFAICSFGWNLFTGKVCYSFGKGPRYIGFLPSCGYQISPVPRPAAH